MNISRKVEEIFSVRLSSMKACRGGNLGYGSDRYVRGGKQTRSRKFKGPTVKRKKKGDVACGSTVVSLKE